MAFPILIPPTANLRQFSKDRGQHLVLSHLLKSDPDYKSFYKSQTKSFTILDNSAHEYRTGGDMQTLWAQAMEIGASEVVLPDCLENAQATAYLSTKALNWLVGQDGGERVRLMVVPQGETFEDYKKCLTQLLSVWTTLWDNGYGPLGATCLGLTIGVSKDYEKWEGGLDAVLTDIIMPGFNSLPPNSYKQIHLLGWGRDLWALGNLIRKYPVIRSVDTAKPFVYAQAGIRLYPGNPAPIYPLRPENYFDLNLEGEDLNRAKDNVWVFTQQAEGRLPK